MILRTQKLHTFFSSLKLELTHIFQFIFHYWPEKHLIDHNQFQGMREVQIYYMPRRITGTPQITAISISMTTNAYKVYNQSFFVKALVTLLAWVYLENNA